MAAVRTATSVIMVTALVGAAFGVGISSAKAIGVIFPGFVEMPGRDERAPAGIHPGLVLLARGQQATVHAGPPAVAQEVEYPTRIADRLELLENQLEQAEITIERSEAIITRHGEGFCFRSCVAARAFVAQRRPSVDLYRRLARTTWGYKLGGVPGTLRNPLPGAVWAGGLGWAVRPADGVNRFHDGIDLTLPTGTPIQAAASGTVERVGPRAGYGIAVEVRHPDGFSTLYAHMSLTDLVTGQQVTVGELVGLVGSTGLAGSPHLHFEYKDAEGNKLDPIAYL